MNSQARIAIWISIVLLMMLDSTADSICSVIFHSVNAKAVLITASQMITPQLLTLRGSLDLGTYSFFLYTLTPGGNIDVISKDQEILNRDI